MQFIPIPEVDEDLIRQAEAAAGASVHAVRAEIGIYRSSIANAKRLAAIVAEKGFREGDGPEMERRLAVAEDYRIKLRQRVFQARTRQGAQA